MTPIEEFEQLIATYFGAPYAIAIDSCTHGIELSLRLLLEDEKEYEFTCPSHTYLSVPMTFEKLQVPWKFTDEKWEDYYQIGDTNVIDAAVLWKSNSYIPGTLMCLSFQLRKHLPIGRCGMILCDDEKDAEILRQMRHDGRPSTTGFWHEMKIDRMGYHYYINYETAATGIEQFRKVAHVEPKKWTWESYPDLSTYEVFKPKQDILTYYV